MKWWAVLIASLFLACASTVSDEPDGRSQGDAGGVDVPSSIAVASIAPPAGTAAGGMAVVVRGRGFEPPIAVYFGDEKAKLKAWRPDSISVITPAGFAGPVDVTVQAAGESVVVAEGFAYEKLTLSFGASAPEEFVAPSVAGRQVLVADIEGDGDLDILQAVAGGANRLWVGDGSGGFVEQGNLRLPHVEHQTVALAAADFDGDGHLDLVEGNQLEPDELWLGSALGVFALAEEPVLDAGLSDTRALLVLDSNGDARPDLLAVTGGAGAVQRLYLNDSELGLGQAVDSAPGTWEFAARDAVAFDADGDGDVDLFFVGDEAPPRLLLNDGDGVFGLASADALPASGDADEYVGAALDLEGDGDLDLVLGCGAGDLVLVNDGTGRFQERTELHLGGQPGRHNRITVKDMDRDGRGDLLLVEATAGSLHFLRNDGVGHLFDYSGKLSALGGAAGFVYVAVGDFDGDLAPDIVASGDGTPTILLLSSSL